MTVRAKAPRAPARKRTPLGKKQLLVIMDCEVIKQAKLAAVENGKNVSRGGGGRPRVAVTARISQGSLIVSSKRGRHGTSGDIEV